MNRKIILFLSSLFFTAIFFLLPRNREWMENRVLYYWKDFHRQKNNTDPEHRKAERFGTHYTQSKHIADFIRKAGTTDEALVLVPSSSYFEANGVKYTVPEPTVFYYFTGLKTISPYSKEAVKANWYVKAEKGNITIEKVRSPQILTEMIKAFKQFSN